MAVSSVQEIRQRIVWMWKSNNEPEDWKRYSDIENCIIENAYQQHENQVELDDFSINFEHLVQVSKKDSNKQEPIKRVTGITDEYIRQARFTLEHTPNTALFRTQRSYQLACYQTFNMAAWLQRILITMPPDDQLPEFVEQVAKGIKEQGAKLGKQKEAEWIANELMKVKPKGKKKSVNVALNCIQWKVSCMNLSTDSNEKQNYTATIGTMISAYNICLIEIQIIISH